MIDVKLIVNKQKWFLCLAFILCWYQGESNNPIADFAELIEPYRGHSPMGFIDSFPFEIYCQQQKDILDEVRILEEHKQQVNRLGFDGDIFLMEVFKEYLTATTLDYNDVESFKPLLGLAETMYQSDKYLPDSIFVYSAISSMLFGTVADSLQTLIYDEKVDANNFHMHYLLSRLSDYRYHVDVPTPNTQKLLSYMKQGRWTYIWHKLRTTYLTEFLLFLGGCFAGILVLFKIWNFRKKRKQKIKLL